MIPVPRFLKRNQNFLVPAPVPFLDFFYETEIFEVKKTFFYAVQLDFNTQFTWSMCSHMEIMVSPDFLIFSNPFQKGTNFSGS